MGLRDGTARIQHYVVRARRGGAIQAVDSDGLVEWARAHGAELVLPHLVGDFVNTGEVLVRVYGGEFDDQERRSSRRCSRWATSARSTKTPHFAIRMMVDIANRALSPAVNDPTTAAQVLDHIGEVLDLIGRTDLAVRTKHGDADTPATVVW